MIFNNWLNWVKNDPKFKELAEEVGSEENEDFNKKAYKSSLYKEFVEMKICPGEKASSSIGNMYSASVFMSLLSMLNYHFDMNNELAGEKVGFISYGSGSKAKIFQDIIIDVRENHRLMCVEMRTKLKELEKPFVGLRMEFKTPKQVTH